jgi:hypothetical protein
MKPWRVSAMITPRSIRTMRALSRNTTSTCRASLLHCAANSSARGDGVTEDRSTNCPSLFETTLCVTTTMSPCSNTTPAPCAARRISAATSSPGRTSGIPGTPITRTSFACVMYSPTTDH